MRVVVVVLIAAISIGGRVSRGRIATSHAPGCGLDNATVVATIITAIATVTTSSDKREFGTVTVLLLRKDAN